MTDAGRQQPHLDIDEPNGDEAAAAIEAMLFASGDVEDIATLSAALGWSRPAVVAAVKALETSLIEERRGVVIQRSGDGIQMVTAPRFAALIERLLGIERRAKLSSAALETLAIVAYRQPVTRAEIEAVRGVDSSGVLSTLVARELVEATGRRSTPGSPAEYATTPEFLQFFGLTSLEDLPESPELSAPD
jgi:segregation and condensation protein B